MLTRIELYAIGLALLAAVGFALYFRGHHAGYVEAKDEYAAAALKQQQESQAKEETQRNQLLQASTTYEQQIAQLKVDAAKRPVPVVRLCDRSASAAVSETPTTPSGPRTEAPAQPDRADGRDIGGPLYDYANDFKACAIKYNTLVDSWPH